MKLIVTTSYSVLKLDTNSEKIDQLHRGYGLYYGIAKNDRNFFVAARKRMVSSKIDQEDENGEILVFDLEFNLKERLQAPFPLRDMHQIGWYEEKLWVTCSYDNMIAIWDGVSWEQWFPLSEPHDGPRDIHHYNSLKFEGEQVWVLAHNRGPSELLAFSLTDRKLLKRIALGNQAHNIWSEKNQLYTCSSIDGEIRGSLGFYLDVGGFPRGYENDKKERCIGVSELAERKERDLTTGRILVFDQSWGLVKSIDLKKEGLVLDILKLEYDIPTKDTWLRKLLSVFNMRKY